MENHRFYLSTIAADAAGTARQYALGLEIAEYCTACNMDEHFPETDAAVREKLAGLTPIVCANLPYNITTPAITALIEAKCFESITVLVQKEVAERLCAAPGTSAYGAFSVFMQYYTEPEYLFAVPRECFEPQPKVTSAVLRAVVRKEPPVRVEDEKLFFRVVYGAFALRRKTLVNSLMTAFGSQLTKEQLAQAIGLDATIRGERLGLAEFAALAAAIGALLR